MHVAELLKELKREFLPSSVAASLAAAGSEAEDAGNESPAATSVGLGLSAMLRDRREVPQEQVVMVNNSGSTPDSPEVVINVDDSLGSTNFGSETSEDDDYLWDSWKQTTGGSHSWRQRIRQRRCERQEHDSDSLSLGSEDKSLSYRSTDSDGLAAGEKAPTAGLVLAGASEVVEYAKYLGIDPLREPQLLRIAQEGLQAPLPEGWTEHEDAEGNIYYHHLASEQSVWQHPLDNFYKDKVARERTKLRDRRRHRDPKGRKAGSCSESASASPNQLRRHTGPLVI